MFKYIASAIALTGVLAAAAISKPSVKIDGNIGEAATVEGVVDEVHVARNSGTIFLDMGGEYPNNTFTAVIWPEDASRFPNVSALSGQTVKVTGMLQLYRGKQEIILREASQLRTE